VATYVGDGRGGYRREGDRYVPDPDGDFELISTPTDTLQSASEVTFNGEVRWRTVEDSGLGASQYPLGVLSLVTRFSASGVTTRDDPTDMFLLLRSGFREDRIRRSKWDWRQEVNFLEGSRTGDGRLTLRREESRDAGFSGGEETLVEGLELLGRFRPVRNLLVVAQPMIEQSRRFALGTGLLRASVIREGGEIESIIETNSQRVEWTLKGGAESRRDRVSEINLIEKRLSTGYLYRLEPDGSLRISGDWRNLHADNPGAGYDLLRGWSTGDNWSAQTSLDYRLGKNLTASANLQSRWRAGRSPVRSGSVEVTVTL
jgi:hypothetical protein